MKKRVFIINYARYFDSVNGNTYNSCRIIDAKNDKEILLNCQYGDDDTLRAKTEIKKILKSDYIDYSKVSIYEFFAGYLSRKKVVNFNY